MSFPNKNNHKTDIKWKERMKGGSPWKLLLFSPNPSKSTIYGMCFKGCFSRDIGVYFRN